MNDATTTAQKNREQIKLGSGEAGNEVTLSMATQGVRAPVKQKLQTQDNAVGEENGTNL